MTRKSPSSDRESAAETPGGVPNQHRASRTRAEPKLYITFLPEGRGGRREEKGSVPVEVDVEAHIEERSDCEPGLYRIEKKRSGEFSGEVLFYEKDEAGNIADDEVADELEMMGANQTAVSSPAEIARVVNAVLDTRERKQTGQADPMDQFRQMRELLKEEREEMQQQLQEQSSKQTQRDTLSEFERFIDLQRKLAPEQVSRDELSADDQAQLTLLRKSGLISEFYANMREMWRAPEAAPESEGFGPSLIDFAKQVLPYVGPTVGPMLGQKLNELMARVDVNSLAQRVNTPTQSGPPVSQLPGATAPPNADPRLVAYSRVIRRVVADLVDNAPADAAVASTLQLVTAFPDFAPQFGQIVNTTPEDVAAFIYAQTHDDVGSLPHCSEWIVAYQSKLRAAGSANVTMDPRGDVESDDDEPLTFDDVLRFIKQQIIEDEEPAAAVSSVIQLLAEQPDLAPMVHQLLANANAELVQFLSQATQTDLTIVANAESFIEKLKAGVAERLRVPVNVSENGHKNAAQAKEVSRASA